MHKYRPEVIEYRKGKLHGNVNLALPVTWQIIGTFLFLTVFALILFLSLASYSRIETVTGTIVPAGGISQIIPSKTGTIERIDVVEGQKIKAGNSLVLINTQNLLRDGSNTTRLIVDSLDGQESDIQRQKNEINSAVQEEQSQLSSRLRSFNSEILGVREQIDAQEELVQYANQDFELAQEVAKKGFISKRDVSTRRIDLLSRQQRLAELRQTLVRHQATTQEIASAAREVRANADAKISALNSQKSDILQHRINIEASSAYQMNAPVSGKVTGLTARIGQPVAIGQSLMTVVPENSKLVAELRVPNAAYGFINVGQEVGIGLNAYPYERFGTVKGRITSVAIAPVQQKGSDSGTTPVFIVTAELDNSYILAYGNKKQLIPGMTLTANIVTEKQSLLRWVFDPLYALNNR